MALGDELIKNWIDNFFLIIVIWHIDYILEGRRLSDYVGTKDGAVILIQAECDFEEQVDICL